MEKTNFRYATRAMFEEGIPTFASIDVSFISLKLILPVLFTIMDEGNVIALIKPQFEAGKENVGKNGIVRDAHIHQAVIRDIAQFAINTGFHVRGLTHSPIKGSGGNREFLIWLTKHHQQINNINLEEVIHDVVLEAHQLE